MELSDDAYSSESDSSKDELESELYSVLHYNTFSGEIPPELLKKYNIVKKDNDFLISVKKKQIEEEVIDASLNDDFESNLDESNNKSEEDSLSYIVPPSPDDAKTTSSIDEEFNKKGHMCESSLVKPCVVYETSLSSDDVDFVRNEIVVCEVDEPRVDIPTEEKEDSDVILISDSDSGNDSDVILEEPVFDTFEVSSTSSLEISTNSRSSDLILNTSKKMKASSSIFPPSEGEEEVIKVKWREVTSPRSWSESMRKYYNRTSKTLKNYDCNEIRKEIKDLGSWDVIEEDLFPRSNRPVKRCSFCRQVDHLVKNCPKRFSNCYICGYPGHHATCCPQRMCLNCGSPNQIFLPMCFRCENQKYRKCDQCHQTGHIRTTCPDTWRRYHATTTGDKLKVKPVVLNENLMCCNCGKKGHLYEDCRNLYWSTYPPNSFLVKNPVELKPTGKRKRDDRSERSGHAKKGRWSDPSTHHRRHRYFDSPQPPRPHPAPSSSPFDNAPLIREPKFNLSDSVDVSPSSSSPRNRKNKKKNFKSSLFKHKKKKRSKKHNNTI